MRKLLLVSLALPLAAQPSRVRVASATNTQAILTYNSPDSDSCFLEVSEFPGFTPLVNDVNPAIFSGSNSDARPGNVADGNSRSFVVGRREARISDTGDNSGRYFSRALEAATTHYYRLTCTGGSATGSFQTANVPFGNTFGEPFQGDPAHPGATPYPYLDPATRNSWFIDPQTGLRHVAVTFASDAYEPAYLGQQFSDAADLNGVTWSNPSGAFTGNTPAAASSGAGYLWIGVRNTQDSMSYDYPARGPAYDEISYGTNGSINYYQVSFQASVSSGTDLVDVCLTVERGACATTPASISISASSRKYTYGAFSATPDASRGGSGADPDLVNARPPINRWQAYTHLGAVTGNGASTLTWTSGNYFNTSWTAWSFLRLSASSAHDACLNGIPHLIRSVASGTSLTLADTIPAGSYYYCAGNFGVLFKRHTPDSRTVSIQNTSFNLSYSPGPSWYSTGDVSPQSFVKLNNGYYLVVPPSPSGPKALYFFDTASGLSTFVGLMKPNWNQNPASRDQWSFETQGSESTPFDNVATQATGTLTWYAAGQDDALKSIILKGEYSGPPLYQENAPQLANEKGAAITYPDLFSVEVANPKTGVTVRWTNITPASQGKDLLTQMARVPGFNPAFMSVSYVGAQNGKLYLQGRGNQNSITVWARLDPATGLIDNYADTWSAPNCRWCTNHSVGAIGDVDFLQFGAAPSNVIGNPGDGSGPWIVTTNDPVPPAPSVACPANSLGVPEGALQCSVFTLNAHPGAHPFDPYDPDPGPHETGFLQTAQPGDWFCVAASTACNAYSNELMVLLAGDGAQWTFWRPGTHNQAGLVPVAGSGVKNFFAWCNGIGENGGIQGGPYWDTSTSGPNARWYRDVEYLGSHDDAKYNMTVGGTAVPGVFVEILGESAVCGIPGPDRAVSCYRARLAGLPGLLAAPLTYLSSDQKFAGAAGNAGSGSHLSVTGLVNGFIDDRPFQSDQLGVQWGDGTTPGVPLPGTSHVFKAMSPVFLARKQLQTAAVAGPHILNDISSAARGDQLSDQTDMSYCVAFAADECRAGSAAGDVFVSASGRTFFSCWSGSVSDISDAYGNTVEDICVFPASVLINSLIQFQIAPDLQGFRHARVLSYLLGRNKMVDVFSNHRVFQDSSWAIGNERWGSLFRSEVVAVRIPPDDSLLHPDRSTYSPLYVPTQGIAGADGVIVAFGYAEYGSDAKSAFYCMSRQENCVAGGRNTAAVPFSWAGEPVSPVPCAEGRACSVALFGIPGRVLYYRVTHTLAGVPVQQDPVAVVTVQSGSALSRQNQPGPSALRK